MAEPTSTPDKQDQQDIGENIREFGETRLPDTQSPIHCVSIVGQIEGHTILPPQNKTTKYEHIIPQLVAIEENPEIHGLLLLMNTVGGDVEAGLAIAEMIAGMDKPSVSLVLGGGHSIGVPLAVAADHSFITATATMTIHPLRMNGLIISVPQTYEYFNKMQERVLQFITSHSRISRKSLQDYMSRTGEIANDIGSVLVGDEAVQCGLIDDLGSLHDALECLKGLIERKKEPS